MGLLFLDFDGVVLESVDLKEKAFAALFPVAAGEQVIAVHRATPGARRHEKISAMFAAVHGRAADAAAIEAMLDRFAQSIRAEMLECPMVPGVRDFLDALPGLSVHVVSAAPEDEIRDVAARRGLARYFKSMSGASAGKETHLNRVLAEDPSRPALYVGDRTSDMDAARRVGIRFLGRVPARALNPFPPEVPVMADFAAGAAAVRQLLGL